MVKDTYALLTGLFVLVLGAAMVAMGLFLGDYGRERDIFVLTTTGAVSGLNPESEVIYRGVKAGKVTKSQLREIAQKKMVDLNANDIDAAMQMIAGSARSMGLEVVEG